jgi:NTE family protein
MTRTDYNINSKNSIVIRPKTGNIGLLDFENVHYEIVTGYVETISMMDSIKQRIARRVDTGTMNKKRHDFVKDMPSLMINEIIVEGINTNQAIYVRKILMPDANPIKIDNLRRNYYKLIADDNIKSIYPKLIYHPESGYYTLLLRVRQERDLKAQFGGDIASLPISEGYIGADYNMWAKKSLCLSGNYYFGNLYTSVQGKARLDIPSSIPYYLEANFTLNAWNYFKSSNEFYTFVTPPYLTTTDRKYAFDAGLPLGNEQKVYGGFSYVNISNVYYQVANFTAKDTPDVTNFNGYSPELVFEHNTLNKKMYATAGSLVKLSARYVNGNEHTTPGSTSADFTQIYQHHAWFQTNLKVDKYYKQRGVLRFGVYAEVNASTQDFFSNYTATALSAPTFAPIPESQTLFLQNYQAYNYGAFGLKNVISTKINIDIRLEAYIFQPYRTIIQQSDQKAANSLIFAERYYMASATAVYNTPVGPISLGWNYFDQKQNPNPNFKLYSYNFLFHFGYIIFNKKALD